MGQSARLHPDADDLSFELLSETLPPHYEFARLFRCGQSSKFWQLVTHVGFDWSHVRLGVQDREYFRDCPGRHANKFTAIECAARCREWLCGGCLLVSFGCLSPTKAYRFVSSTTVYSASITWL